MLFIEQFDASMWKSLRYLNITEFHISIRGGEIGPLHLTWDFLFYVAAKFFIVQARIVVYICLVIFEIWNKIQKLY